MKTAEKIAGVSTPTENQVVTISVSKSFEEIAQKVDLSVPLRRPKKCAPAVHPSEESLQEELRAWDEASDCDFESFESDI